MPPTPAPRIYRATDDQLKKIWESCAMPTSETKTVMPTAGNLSDPFLSFNITLSN